MKSKLFDNLRDSGDVVVDHSGRKIAVYSNGDGLVALLVQEDGVEVLHFVAPEEIGDLCAALMRAGKEAKPIADAIETDFEAFTAIAKARGGAYE